LSDNAAIIFDFNLQLIVWENAFAKLQNFCESIRSQPVLCVVADMHLQEHFFFRSTLATTVDKLFSDVTNFGQVSVTRNKTAVGQNEPGKTPRMLTQGLFQALQLHDPIYMLVWEYRQTDQAKARSQSALRCASECQQTAVKEPARVVDEFA
jgi:membrane protease subunit (stomatin/prohibitin family)